MSKEYQFRLRSASRIEKLRTEASAAKSQRRKPEVRTVATNTPEQCRTLGRDTVSSTTFQTWKQLLFSKKTKRQKSVVTVNASPLEYIKLMEELKGNKSQKRSTRQTQGKEVRRIGRFRKLDTRIVNEFQKNSFTELSKQIMNMLQSSSVMNISTGKMIKIIQSSLKNPELQKIFLKKDKLLNPISVVKSYSELVSNIKLYYLSNPNSYLFMYLKQFKANLEVKMSRIDNSMLESLEQSIEKYNRMESERSEGYIATKKSLKHRIPNNILTKIKEYEKTHGEIGMISELNRKRYEVFDRINLSLDRAGKRSILC